MRAMDRLERLEILGTLVRLPRIALIPYFSRESPLLTHCAAQQLDQLWMHAGPEDNLQTASQA